MAQPFPVRCPACNGGFMVNNPQLVGKRVKCPQCHAPFLVQAPAVAQPASAPRPAPRQAAAAPAPAAPADDPLGLGDDLWETGGDPLADPLGAAPATGSTLGSRKPNRRRSSGGLQQLVQNPLLWMGAGGVGLIVLLIWGLMNLPGGGDYGGSSASGNTINMTWLPANTEAVAYADLQAVLASSEMQELRTNPIMQTQIQEMEQVTGVSLDDLRSITIGFPGRTGPGGPGNPPFDPEQMVMVVRMKRTPDLQALGGGALQPTEHGGQSYYVSSDGTMGVWAADAEAIVVGGAAAVRSAIDSGKADPRRPDFDFVERGQDAFFAWVPKDRTVFSQAAQEVPTPPPGGPPQMQESLNTIKAVVQNDLEALCLGGAINSGNFNLKLQLVCATSDAAGKLTSGVDSGVAEVKKLMDQMKTMMPAENTAQFEEVLNSLSARQSGKTAMISVSLPKSMGENTNLPLAALLPAVQSARNAARRAQAGNSGLGATGITPRPAPVAASRNDMNDLKQIGLALHNHHDAYRKFPPANDPKLKDSSGKPLLSWRVHILPFLGHEPLYNQFHLNEPWNSPHNQALVAQIPEVFKSDLGGAPGSTTYLAIDGAGTIFENGDGCAFRDIVDGTSNTLMVIQVPLAKAVPWTQPTDYALDPANPAAGLGPGVAAILALFADGSVHSFPAIDPQNLLKGFRRNDGPPEL